MTILPTGSCFDDVLDYQDMLFQVDPHRIFRQYIVHGICLVPEGLNKDELFAHAWVEDDVEDRVYQSGVVDGQKVWWGCNRAEWRQMMRVQEQTRYTFAEVLALNWQTNHYGPWEERYREFCKKSCGKFEA